MTTALRLTGISKAYPGVQALDDVSFACDAGEVHAVVGENGSGKSTLIAVAAGVVEADRGKVEIAGQTIGAANPSAARAAGLAAVYQDNSLVPELSVARNLYLACPAALRPPYRSRVSWAQDYLNSIELTIDAGALVQDLSLGARQLLEISKAILTKPRVLILDEPTNALGAEETEWLAGLVRDYAKDGASIVYVSHRLREVIELADRLTVLRDGRQRGTFEAAGLSESEILSLMVGVDLAVEFPDKSRVERPTPSLQIDELKSADFGPVSLTVAPGEIVGLAGAEGNGQRSFARALGGLSDAEGVVRLDGQEIKLGSPSRAIAAGIVPVSGERMAESLFPVLGVRENMTLPVLAQVSWGGFVERGTERRLVDEQVEEFGIASATIEQPVGTLSGGNQQKVVLGRSSLAGGKVLVIDEPTQGVDARARMDLYRALRRAVDDGKAVIVNSSDALELAGLCDRVFVFSRGRVVAELVDEFTESDIVSAFLTVTHAATSGGEVGEEVEAKRHAAPAALPLILIAALLAGVSVFTASKTATFATDTNWRFLLLNAVPLVLLACAQLNVLLIGGIDLSVGSQVGLTAVLASFWLAEGHSDGLLLIGLLGVLGVGVLVGLVNAFLIRRVGLSPIIATVAMLSILEGVGLTLRETAGGSISNTVSQGATKTLSFIPVSFLVILGLAVLADLTLERTAPGIGLRAVGFRLPAARRNGVKTGWVEIRAYVLCSLLATVAGLFLAVQTGTGDATIGAQLTLGSVAAAVLGGASLFGGRGFFVGCLLGGTFFALINNVIPLLTLPEGFSYVVTGGLTLIAVAFYSGVGGGWRQGVAKLKALRRPLPGEPEQAR